MSSEVDQMCAALRTRATIRRSIPRAERDRIADQLEGAADMLDQLQHQLAAARTWYDVEYPPEEGRDQIYPWDYT